MGICQQSEEEVRKIVAQFRDIEAAKGVTREGVEAVKTVLIKLAKKKKSFPLSDFSIDPNADGNDDIYRLSEDDDHDHWFALYASIGMPGKGVWPHPFSWNRGCMPSTQGPSMLHQQQNAFGT